MERALAITNPSSSLLSPAIASSAGYRAKECKLITVQFGRPWPATSVHLQTHKCCGDRGVSGHLQHRRLNGNLQVLNAISEASEQSAHDHEVLPQIKTKSFADTFAVLCRFSRFYALRGAVLCVISNCLLAVQSRSDLTQSFAIGLSQAIIGACLASSFVITSNQLSDIEIDKINKPYLPLASGELSVKNGILITVFYAILGFGYGLYTPSWPLKLLLLCWYAYGIGYSAHLPLLRWKGTSTRAVISNGLQYGVFIPLFSYLHAQVHIFGRQPSFSNLAVFSAAMITIYIVAIIIFKDLTDVEGDVKHGVKTFASQLGLERVFWICVGILEIACGMGIVVGLLSPYSWIRLIMVTSHAILGLVIWKNASMVDIGNKKDLASFYLLMWKLLDVEYVLMPALRF